MSIFLDIVPSVVSETSWRLLLEKERKLYSDLKERFIFDPAKAKEASDWSLNNPLSLSDESPWKQYFADMELRKLIMQDVERTFPEQEIFRDPAVQLLMSNVLFIWSKLNPEISYRQGMHELLGIVLIVVDGDKVELEQSAENADSYGVMFDKDYVEHDAATIFFRMMHSLKTWYEVGEGSSASFKSSEQRNRAASKTIPIVAACKRIQGELLMTLDQELARHLDSHGVEPQLYGLRWLRLLFAREFTLTQVLTLWDGLFASDTNLALTEWVAVAMLIFIREQVLASDFSGMMQVLMKYQPIDHISTSEFIASARGLRDRYHTKSSGTVYIALVPGDSVDQPSTPQQKYPSATITSSRPKRSTAPWVAYDTHTQSQSAIASKDQQSLAASAQQLSSTSSSVGSLPHTIPLLRQVKDRDQSIADELTDVILKLSMLRLPVEHPSLSLSSSLPSKAVSISNDERIDSMELAATPDQSMPSFADAADIALVIKKLTDIRRRLMQPINVDFDLSADAAITSISRDLGNSDHEAWTTPSKSQSQSIHTAPFDVNTSTLSNGDLAAQNASSTRMGSGFSLSKGKSNQESTQHQHNQSARSQQWASDLATSSAAAAAALSAKGRNLLDTLGHDAVPASAALTQGADLVLGQLRAGLAGVNKAFSNLFDEGATPLSPPAASSSSSTTNSAAAEASKQTTARATSASSPGATRIGLIRDPLTAQNVHDINVASKARRRSDDRRQLATADTTSTTALYPPRQPASTASTDADPLGAIK
eukprot:jgi/Hompol1/6600/HPOL_001397-RA